MWIHCNIFYSHVASASIVSGYSVYISVPDFQFARRPDPNFCWNWNHDVKKKRCALQLDAFLSCSAQSRFPPYCSGMFISVNRSNWSVCINMPSCSIKPCHNNNTNTKGRNIQFHRFPKNAEIVSKWVAACGNENLNLENLNLEIS